MNILIINIDTELSINNEYYLTHISYLIYNLTSLKLVLIKTHDINLYHNAHKVLFNKRVHLDNYKIGKSKIINIIAILKYYLEYTELIICYDYNYIKKVINQECIRNKIEPILTDDISSYCLMNASNKIFKWNIVSEEVISEQSENIYLIYEKLFITSYRFKSNKTLFNCILILRCYYKFVTGKDLEKYDINMLSLRIMNY